MNKILNTYIPYLSVSFSLVMIFVIINNLIHGDTKGGFLYFILELIGYLIVTGFIDYLVGKINFKKYTSHFMTEILFLYPLTMVFATLCNWFNINFYNILFYSIVYVIAIALLHYYFYLSSKKQADEINQFLKGNRS